MHSKEVVKNFNKLVCGSECLKIMIISKFTHFDKEIIKVLSKVAENIKGEVYLIVIEHPGKWDYAKGYDNYSKVYSYDTNTKMFIENV
ncbi:MAG TPA: hypothetical protein DG753_03220 [Clostridium sp.]|nr:hypothetical protein [Clostridium sp.]